MSFLNSLASIGTHHTVSPSERRSIFLSNTLSLVMALTGYFIFFIYLGYYGPSGIAFTIPAISLLSLVPLLLNHLNHSKVAQVWTSLFLPLAMITLSLVSKNIYYERVAELDYFSFRVVVLSCSIISPIFFSLNEKKYLIITSGVIAAILMLHDPLHSLFNVPYRPYALKESNYDFMNVVFFFMYILTTGAVIFVKSVSETNEERANKLIEQLNLTNHKLNEKNLEVEQQNQEITTYVNNLDVHRKKLTNAYQIIEEQRNLLFVQNKNLSTELLEKNNELTETNNELIRHNNELRQFSYTVSHNLRGPVASLMGLLKLFNTVNLNADNLDIFRHLETSTLRLDNIIKDLSKIIDIRNDIFQIRQQIDLKHEVSEILLGLNREITTQNINIIQTHTASGIIYSVRPMVHSIIYNLVSNAIKYRSPERGCVIDIITREDKRYYYLEVRDNGLGIDLQRDKENLFKLYKRFHHHTEGKGLGLYLVKLQAEALGGTIVVTSELNKFSHFTVKLRKPENAERQVLFEDESSEVFFDATLNCIGIVWKNSSPDPIGVLRKIVEFIKVYNTPNYIADLSAAGQDQNGNDILFTYIIPETAASGLKQVAVIRPLEVTSGNNESLDDLLAYYKIKLRYFTEPSGAITWIQEENQQT
jgi:signal transduction histidine kinase